MDMAFDSFARCCILIEIHTDDKLVPPRVRTYVPATEMSQMEHGGRRSSTHCPGSTCRADPHTLSICKTSVPAPS
jgi:hypothetical protein